MNIIIITSGGVAQRVKNVLLVRKGHSTPIVGDVLNNEEKKKRRTSNSVARTKGSFLFRPYLR